MSTVTPSYSPSDVPYWENFYIITVAPVIALIFFVCISIWSCCSTNIFAASIRITEVLNAADNEIPVVAVELFLVLFTRTTDLSTENTAIICLTNSNEFVINSFMFGGLILIYLLYSVSVARKSASCCWICPEEALNPHLFVLFLRFCGFVFLALGLQDQPLVCWVPDALPSQFPKTYAFVRFCILLSGWIFLHSAALLRLSHPKLLKSHFLKTQKDPVKMIGVRGINAGGLLKSVWIPGWAIFLWSLFNIIAAAYEGDLQCDTSEGIATTIGFVVTLSLLIINLQISIWRAVPRSLKHACCTKDCTGHFCGGIPLLIFPVLAWGLLLAFSQVRVVHCFGNLDLATTIFQLLPDPKALNDYQKIVIVQFSCLIGVLFFVGVYYLIINGCTFVSKNERPWLTFRPQVDYSACKPLSSRYLFPGCSKLELGRERPWIKHCAIHMLVHLKRSDIQTLQGNSILLSPIWINLPQAPGTNAPVAAPLGGMSLGEMIETGSWKLSIRIGCTARLGNLELRIVKWSLSPTGAQIQKEVAIDMTNWTQVHDVYGTIRIKMDTSDCKVKEVLETKKNIYTDHEIFAPATTAGMRNVNYQPPNGNNAVSFEYLALHTDIGEYMVHEHVDVGCCCNLCFN